MDPEKNTVLLVLQHPRIWKILGGSLKFLKKLSFLAPLPSSLSFNNFLTVILLHFYYMLEKSLLSTSLVVCSLHAVVYCVTRIMIALFLLLNSYTVEGTKWYY